VIRKKAASRTRTPLKYSASRKPTRGAAAAAVAPQRKAAPKRRAPVRAQQAEHEVFDEPRAAPELTSKRRRELRADAHGLEPIVHVGHGGISEAVERAVSRALNDHELIKVRLHEPEDKQAMAEQLAAATRSGLCGLVGHTVILYRPKPKQRGVSGVARSAIKRNQKKGGRR
jgi:RNA-binding protein